MQTEMREVPVREKVPPLHLNSISCQFKQLQSSNRQLN